LDEVRIRFALLPAASLDEAPGGASSEPADVDVSAPVETPFQQHSEDAARILITHSEKRCSPRSAC
jgi:hypothetical protein